MIERMRITKFGHASVRLEHDGAALLIDPGMFTQPEAMDSLTGILITHEHADHWTPEMLAMSDAPIWTIAAVADQINAASPELGERITVVSPGESFDAGVPVTVVGEQHAVIHPDFPRIFNSGFTVDLGGTKVHHPGDAFEMPEGPIDVLLVPAGAPWMRASEAVEYARAVGAPVNLGIHDRIYTDLAHGVLEKQMEAFLPGNGQRYVRLTDGSDLSLG